MSQELSWPLDAYYELTEHELLTWWEEFLELLNDQEKARAKIRKK